jgi:hypothetical protein
MRRPLARLFLKIFLSGRGKRGFCLIKILEIWLYNGKKVGLWLQETGRFFYV